MRNLKLTVALATLLFSVVAQAHDYTLGSLSIDHPWARATAPGAPVGGGFMSINGGRFCHRSADTRIEHGRWHDAHAALARRCRRA